MTKPKTLWNLAFVGSEMAAYTIVGGVLDIFFSTLPWFLCIGTLLGMLVMLYRLHRIAIKMQPPRD